MNRVVAVIAVSLVLGATQANAADLKAGWSDAQLSAVVSGCVAGVMTPAKRDYAKRAAQAGKSGDDFPEAAVRKSIEPMCACLSRRIAESWTFAEFVANPQALSQPLIQEAMSGGRCRPEGLLGEALANAKKK